MGGTYLSLHLTQRDHKAAKVHFLPWADTKILGAVEIFLLRIYKLSLNPVLNDTSDLSLLIYWF